MKLGSFHVYNLTSKFTIELAKALFVINATRCCAAAPPSTVPTPAALETGFVQGRLLPPSYQQGGDYGGDENDYGDDEDHDGDDGHCSRNRHINKVVIMVMLMLMLMATAPASFISIR